MSVISNYYLNSDLAFAAYTELASGVDPIPALTEPDIGMSSVQAETFSENWRVVDQFNENPNGLSATVFESVATGERYLAVRGTDDLSDFGLTSSISLFWVRQRDRRSMHHFVIRLARG